MSFWRLRSRLGPILAFYHRWEKGSHVLGDSARLLDAARDAFDSARGAKTNPVRRLRPRGPRGAWPGA